jgi:hypothetical protein
MPLGEICEIVAAYLTTTIDDHDVAASIPGTAIGIALSDGRLLSRVSKGRYKTRRGEIVVSADPNAP